jgi:hypothetical protein
MILRAHGLKITSGGTFATVMHTLLSEIEGEDKAPQELDRLLKPAADAANKLTVQECSQFVEWHLL